MVQPYSRSTEKGIQADNDNDKINDYDDVRLMDPILIDFGIAKEANSMFPTTTITTTGTQGTQNYIDPALLNGKLKRATTASDVWAFGG